ncbi:3-phosphoshikimate 1-carboxyvinyltransferase [Rubrobacter calidifluminis]|uniref:3-phosphoshikimate 1-carboxyvinyltransferase n=1 Tax=Rubrobacter calidifluminis TaxID=1392640 RepID=UPI0023620F52|nr:3-phosphoshikimate 1-carboxyvinyltransferase [Rubrobacter calidifluminis]
MAREIKGVPGRDFGVEDVRGNFPDELEIVPLKKPPDAEVGVPGSKSITNRALILAALAAGRSTISNPLFSDDTFWLMQALVQLGFEVFADVPGRRVEVVGLGGRIPAGKADIFVGNAGTVARFLPPFLALGRGVYRLDGTPRMRERPVSDLVDALRALGVRVDYEEDEGRFPIVVHGGGIPGGSVTVPGDKSSQFLSGLLLAAPYTREGLSLKVGGQLVSKPYVEITARMMRSFGGTLESFEGGYRVSPGAYRARHYAVEPDASAASYFFAVAAATGGRIRVAGLPPNAIQGDLRFVHLLKRMGCQVAFDAGVVEVRGPERLRGIDADMGDISDTMMTLAAIAPFADRPTTMTGLGHTRHQETDRLSAVARELSRLGVRVEERVNSLRIIPGKDRRLRRGLVRTYDDHRMAMSFAVAGLVAEGIRIENPGCVTKTLPGYFGLLEGLRG